MQGQCAINTKANKHLPYNVYANFGNILVGAYLLRGYLDIYETYPKAIKRYKGFSKLGERQANHVISIYNSIK